MTAGSGLVVIVLVLATAVSTRAAVGASRSALARRRLVPDHAPGRAQVGAGRAGGPPSSSPLHGVLRPPARLDTALAAAGVPWPAPSAWRAWLVVVGLAGGAGWVAGGPPLAGVAATAAVGGPALALVALRGRADRRLETELPGVLEGVARGLRSGASLRVALHDTSAFTPGQVGRDLSEVVARARHGVPLAEALDAWAGQRPLPGVRLAVAVLAMGAETGGPQARAVDGAAATLRDRLALAKEVRALTAQAQASAVVIALAPLAFAALAVATDPRTADFLFRTTAGVACLAAGLALDGMAGWWMSRLVRVPT